VPGAGDPQFITPGVGRADVWVFDATSLGSVLGGMPLRIVTLFGDTPRALAVSNDGNTVYAAIFKSGNQTTALSEGAVCNGFDSAGTCTVDGHTMPGGLPPPDSDAMGEPAPETGLIVKFDPADSRWKDELGRNWSSAVQFDLPDEDVFAINATTLAQTAMYSGVGTTLFNMAVNPASGALYVSNTDSRNEVRFEGPGVFGGSTVQGHLAESRITVVTGSGVFRAISINTSPTTSCQRQWRQDHSPATPTGMAVSPEARPLR
jgi:DNA-binding beta-propeller fold protein YncE